MLTPLPLTSSFSGGACRVASWVSFDGDLEAVSAPMPPLNPVRSVNERQSLPGQCRRIRASRCTVKSTQVFERFRCHESPTSTRHATSSPQSPTRAKQNRCNDLLVHSTGKVQLCLLPTRQAMADSLLKLHKSCVILAAVRG